jgi:Omp85 superfamily domain
MDLRVILSLARVLAALPLIMLATHARAAVQADAPATEPTSRPAEPQSLFFDPEDGAFDISGFLSTRTGFLPLAVPITEPAVGYGLAAGLTFFHEQPRVLQTPAGPRVVPPNATAVFGMATENGSWAGGAGHLHTWNDGRIRYTVGGGYGSLNLDWFGQGDAFNGRAFSYDLEATGFVQKLTFKLGETDFFFGPTQRLIDATTEFKHAADLPDVGILPDELDSTISGVGLTLVYDTRNSLFSPTRGTRGHLSYTLNDDAIGSDFDYGRFDTEVCQYEPLGGPWTVGLRAQAGYVGDDGPFYDLAGVNLRGIQVGRYVDNAALTLEVELRWDLSPRWTIVGFGGVGWAADKFDEIDDAEDQWAGGAGFRYLVARQYDMRLGCDVARGPEEWAFYVTVGTGWLRD